MYLAFSTTHDTALNMSPVRNAVANPAPIGMPIPIHNRSKATTFLKGACTILFHVLPFTFHHLLYGKFFLPILHLFMVSSGIEETFAREDLTVFLICSIEVSIFDSPLYSTVTIFPFGFSSARLNVTSNMPFAYLALPESSTILCFRGTIAW